MPWDEATHKPVGSAGRDEKLIIKLDGPTDKLTPSAKHSTPFFCQSI